MTSGAAGGTIACPMARDMATSDLSWESRNKDALKHAVGVLGPTMNVTSLRGGNTWWDSDSAYSHVPHGRKLHFAW